MAQISVEENVVVGNFGGVDQGSGGSGERDYIRYRFST